jgi:glyoxylase-like metal-dependent hydrolase (beta-lactamase superfamily II)
LASSHDGDHIGVSIKCFRRRNLVFKGRAQDCHTPGGGYVVVNRQAQIRGAALWPRSSVERTRLVPRVVVTRPCTAPGRDGQRQFRVGDAPYAEIRWVDPHDAGTSTYDLEVDRPKKLDGYVTRILAPNAGRMTGPGTNTYLVGEREMAVIDPGPASSSHIDAILAYGARRIRWILLTHTHRDHAPAAEAVKLATGATIIGQPAPERVPGHAMIAIDRVVTDGESVIVDGLVVRAIHTPGHASNHLCYLLEKTRMLFSGDQLVQGFTVVIAPPDGNMRAYLCSLGRLRSLDIAILAPGHGYLIGDPNAEIQSVIRHRSAREDKVRKVLLEAGGSTTLQMLLPRVYDDVSPALHPVAELSLLAHLQKLVEDGEVNSMDGCWSWSTSLL